MEPGVWLRGLCQLAGHTEAHTGQVCPRACGWGQTLALGSGPVTPAEEQVFQASRAMASGPSYLTSSSAFRGRYLGGSRTGISGCSSVGVKCLGVWDRLAGWGRGDAGTPCDRSVSICLQLSPLLQRLCSRTPAQT